MSPADQPLLGLCPIGKFVFSHEDAVRQKQRLQERFRQWGVRHVDLDGVLPDGLVRDQAHVEPAVRHFRGAEVDGLFIPHCNFGTEGAAGRIAEKLGVPVLLWGPRDDAPLPDGTRLRDTLCGLFATSKVLHRLGVRFAYIENVATDDPRFRAGVDTFRRAVNVAAAVRRGIRIGHIGQRIGFFWTTIVNEGELLERFNVEVVPLSLAAFIEAALRRMAEHRAAYEAEAAGLRRSCRVEGFENDTPLMRILAVRDQILAHIAEQGLDAVAIEDFMPLVDAMGAYCFYANSLVGDTCPVACESDIHGAVSLVLLRRAAMAAEPVFLADLTVRHPQNDNGVLLWHAGAPASMRHPDDPVRLGRHWILPSPLAGMPHFRLKDGPITIARFDGDRGEYELAAGEGRTVAGPATLNNYTWMEVADWSRWERRLIRGPFIHHAGMMYGHVAGGLLEACRFIPGLRPVPLDRPDD